MNKITLSKHLFALKAVSAFLNIPLSGNLISQYIYTFSHLTGVNNL